MLHCKHITIGVFWQAFYKLFERFTYLRTGCPPCRQLLGVYDINNYAQNAINNTLPIGLFMFLQMFFVYFVGHIGVYTTPVLEFTKLSAQWHLFGGLQPSRALDFYQFKRL
jgi:hypothetical protein